MKRLWVPLVMAVVFGCESEAPPPPTPIVKKKKEDDQKATQPKAPVSDDFAYSPVGKRDPFRPFYVDQDEAEEARSKRELTELQHFELDQLKLVAIMSGTSQPMAMFEDPTGKGHVVTTGTMIGRNGGRVDKILKDELVILEELADATGRKKASPITVKLPGEELVLDGGGK